MSFVQDAPVLANQYTNDRVLRSWLERNLAESLRTAIEHDLDELGAHAAQAWRHARERTPATPTLTRHDAWGARVDRIELTPTWREGPALAARYGLVAAGHEAASGAHARSDQFARVYLHHVASEFFTCPLAMSDGAATALEASGNRTLIDRVVPRLLSRDAATLWLSGQWMTETSGGSDVGGTETVARRDANGRWRLYGRKWFTSAIQADMALALARPDGGSGGSAALALFHLETRDAQGRWNGLRIERLKDKLGTRELPTAEVRLEGTLAEPVAGLDHGVRAIAPMLNVTRIWNAVCALATMRRAVALAVDYARRREAFGAKLIDHPLHRATLAAMQAEFEAAFGFVFHVSGLLGRVETGAASEDEQALLRLATPIAKLWTGKLAVQITSEACEAFGGAGYIENTGLPLLLRDAHVYPIWEGTTNVLALDALRVISKHGLDAPIRALDAGRKPAAAENEAVAAALVAAQAWLERHADDRAALEAGARGLALTLARAIAASLLARQADWAMGTTNDPRPGAALARFIGHGLDRLAEPAAGDALLLADR
jgi:alkylation response protein AidB-like acyl-CoA dehydrogenase